MEQAYFERFVIELEDDDALSGSHPGPCDDDIKALLELPYIKAQFDDILKPDDIRDELKDYGAWDEDELANDDDNQKRILWCACCDIRDELELKD